MIFAGCFLSGMGMASFPVCGNKIINFISFAMLGFGLSMLRGPLMKTISENLKQSAAEIVCVLFSASSFAGPLIASVLSVAFNWKTVFYVISAFALILAFGSFFVLSHLENKGIVKYSKDNANVLLGIKKLFKIKNFLFYLTVGAICEVVSSSITFWIPSYLNEFLSLSAKMTASIFSLMSLVGVFSPFVCIFVYHRIIKHDILINIIFFGMSTLLILTLLITQTNPVLNVSAFVIARVMVGCASTTLWSIFIPSLANYGVVSTGNGFFDFSGYAVASIFSAVFSVFVEKIGWSGLIVMWALIISIGFFVALSVFIKNKLQTRIY